MLAKMTVKFMTMKLDSTSIPIFLDAKLLRMGIPAYIGWDATCSTQHHALIGGNSGSGKSTHLMLWLFKALKRLPTARLYLLDFKGSDELRYLRTVPNARYFTREKCADGLILYHQEIASRMQDNLDRSPLFILFDEFSSFISYMSIADKALAKQCQVCLMNVIFMSREVGGYCFMCTQRPDQSIMPSGGVRDQMGVRVWWNRFSSADAAKMMFGDMYKQIPEDYIGGVGRGIAYIDGKGLFEVVAPRIRRMETVKEAIAEFVTR
ncbi:MAG: hypothetical protein K2M42_08575 [Oscillospiraceae bacterium]|nr:hypothetical protein [Oscillospiraceae bacterium]